MKNLTLITGGARSGKSSYAESLARNSNKTVYYLATMKNVASDKEQQKRIEKHRLRRPDNWHTIEASKDLSKHIEKIPTDTSIAIIDCLSLFVTSLLFDDEDIEGKDCSEIVLKNPWQKENKIIDATKELLAQIEKRTDIEFLVVTNEVGFGIVPATELGRVFRDFLGFVNQLVAKNADNVYLLCSGIPIKIKPGNN